MQETFKRVHYCSSRTQVVESFCGVAEVLPSRRVVPVLDQTSQGVLRVLVELPVQLEQHHILQVDHVIAVVQGARRHAPCPPRRRCSWTRLGTPGPCRGRC